MRRTRANTGVVLMALLWQLSLFAAWPGSPAWGGTKAPLKNFDFVWKTFHEQYAFFRQRGIDWQKSKATYRKKLTKHSSPKQLYRVVRRMVDQMRDSHVTIDAPEKITKGYRHTFDHGPYDLATLRSLSKQVAAYHLRSHHSYASGKLRWGMLKQTRIGYLQINSFEDLLHCDDLKALTKNTEAQHTCGWWMVPDLALRIVMKRVLDDLKEASSTIIDVRFNTGGYDSFARLILSHFVERTTRVYSKRTKRKDGLSPKQTFHLKPARHRKDGKIVVLMSHATASAAEVFLLSTLQLKHVTRMGSRTRGTFSDMLNVEMPNGWTITLSHQRYRDNRGRLYEGEGIQPDIPLDYPRNQPGLFAKKIKKGMRDGKTGILRAKTFLLSTSG